MTELNTEGDSIGPTDSVPAPKPVSSNNDAFQALDLFTTYLDAKLKGLRDDIREEHDLSANSFKRLKKEREVKFKFNGNKKQFDFNSEVLEEVELAEKAVVKGDSSSTRDSLRNIRTLLEKRNKLIRIADKSVCGWDTVNESQNCRIQPENEVKYSDDTFEIGVFEENYEISEKHFNDTGVKGRLKRCVDFWRNTIEANDYILNVLSEGYLIPFISTPPNKFNFNNKSAFKHSEFVSKAILELLEVGSVVEMNTIPFVVNPLSVSVGSTGKKRLILDLREVNLHVWKEKV
ncbi:uncharacterized protein LOC110461960 isoform X1 [Mizuhopecten yessoensis]|uniref:uncharacterized protein LOC110461960 isoform X1 n=1 Tax=Mizuhopecten yessoensis TaxID=6573 RepID=UPI000B45C68F|nr:uncharacterized protein LOC110461960 isoform X1 [Mizuhopecten yessoensis]